MLHGRRILLIIGGGIAAYKSLDLIRRLQDRGAKVVPVMTRAAEEFVTPLSLTTTFRDLLSSLVNSIIAWPLGEYLIALSKRLIMIC